MSALISRAQHVAGDVGNQIQVTTNKWIPPKQREEKLKEMRRFSQRNPKLATFLGIQIALAAVPLTLFIVFALSTLCISLVTSILVALTSAFIYTSFAVGIALLFLVPTLFIASCAATCFFLWGLVVYLILQRFNEGEAPAKRGTPVGDKLHGLTGDRLGWLVDGQDERRVRNSVALGKGSLDAKASSGMERPNGGHTSLGQGGNGHANGEAEWDTKWANETHLREKGIGNDFGAVIEAK